MERFVVASIMRTGLVTLYDTAFNCDDVVFDKDLPVSMTKIISDHPEAYHIAIPDRVTVPLVFASPHSGRKYPSDFLAMSRLDARTIRRSEDAFVEEIFGCAPEFGAPILMAEFPRAYIDANREAYELDPNMFDDRLPDWVNTSTSRVAAGLGTVAKVVAGGAEIYRKPLSFHEVHNRIERTYKPYHSALQSLIDQSLEMFGCCLVIDCHSMPSLAAGIGIRPQADIVLGDSHGSSCDPEITHIVERTLRDLGMTVTRNKPYAGGFTTRHYAARHNGVHTLQIEINRALYMHEGLIRKSSGFNRLSERIRLLIARLATIESGLLSPAQAAE